MFFRWFLARKFKFHMQELSIQKFKFIFWLCTGMWNGEHEKASDGWTLKSSWTNHGSFQFWDGTSTRKGNTENRQKWDIFQFISNTVTKGQEVTKKPFKNRQTDRQVSVQNCIKLKIAPFSPQNSIIKVSYGANLVTTGANCPGSSFGGRPAGAFTPPEISVVLQKKPPQLLIQMGFWGGFLEISCQSKL